LERPAPYVIRLVAAALVLAAQALAAANPLADPPPPDASAEGVIDRLHAALIASMRAGDDLDAAERRRALRPLVERAFDFARMGRFVLGRTWSQMDSNEQARFIESFSKLTVANYADRFTDYDGQRFEDVGAERMGSRRALVERRFVRAEQKPMPFEYILERDDEGTWRIINVIVDGVSDLAMRRSLYTQAYADGGIDAVIKEMEGSTPGFAEG